MDIAGEVEVGLKLTSVSRLLFDLLINWSIYYTSRFHTKIYDYRKHTTTDCT